MRNLLRHVAAVAAVAGVFFAGAVSAQEAPKSIKVG
jgi:hypothetical protein